MSHVNLPGGLPGIVGPMRRFPDTGRPLAELAEVLLRGPSSLTTAEREIIAAFVSARNRCVFFTERHSAAARYLLGDEAEMVDLVRTEGEAAPLNARMRALLAIAAKVQEDGRSVTVDDVQLARAAGADDKAIHDTVLVAAAFCMYSRYVDGLATWTPTEPDLYRQMGRELAEVGYLADEGYVELTEDMYRRLW